MELHIFWFVMLGVLMAGYAILDGFDLGVGILYLGAKTDDERRLLLNSIGPLWDGNEVWLITFGGAFFAAFPNAYATVFSGFYTAFMLLLFCLIFRAVSMEFRSKHASPVWRKSWDIAFFVSSTVAVLLFGVAVGNCMMGLPIDDRMEYAGGFLDLLRPFPLLVGALALAAMAMHGAVYLCLKIEGEMQNRIRNWMWTSFGLFMTLYMFTTIVTLAMIPRSLHNFAQMPWAWGIVLVNVLAVGNIPRSIYLNRPSHAFMSSCAAIAALVALFGVSLFPELVVSNLDPANSLTIYNASSSEKTLHIMQIIAFMGLPFVLSYTAAIYWIFRGKVSIGKFSY